MKPSELVLPVAAGTALGLAAGAILMRTCLTWGEHRPSTSLTSEAESSKPGTSAVLDGQHTQLQTGDGGDLEQTQDSQAGPSRRPRNSTPSTQPELLQYRPIGYLRSCFTTRNGTPRQPMLVPAARSRLELLYDVPHASFEGLEEWSHVWILYVFHDNTAPQTKTAAGDLTFVKGKIRVPRLNGEKVGLFATRSPHRPVPIGLSVAQVIRVAGRVLVLGGADVVDGSPVLDIKPYVPFCDAVPLARAPAYVQAEADDEPLAVSKVVMTEVGRKQLTACWHKNTHRTLYASPDEYIQLVCQVLSRDIRNLRQRLHVGKAAQQRNTASLMSAAAVVTRLPELQVVDGVTSPGEHSEASSSSQGGCADQGTGVFHVVLEGIDVSYDVSSEGVVIIGGGSLDTELAVRHVHKHLLS